jgi:hypothetical protein
VEAQALMDTDLYEQAASLLAACDALLGARAPATAFVSPSLPVFDCCPMLAVYVPALGEALTSPTSGALVGGHRRTFGRVNLTTLVVTIVRCDQEKPDNMLPDVAAKQATAAEVMQDVWTLWNGLYRLVDDGVLFEGCGERYLDGARLINSSGGCVGYTITLRISLPGYDPGVGT